MSQPAYTIRNVKTFMGHEGPGYNIVLLRDGQKVAEVIHEGNGGEPYIYWQDIEAEQVKANVTNNKGEPLSFFSTPEGKIFYEFLETLPRQKATEEMKEYFPDGLKMDEDLYMWQLLEEHEQAKEVKRYLNKWHCFITPKHKAEQSFGHYDKMHKGMNFSKERATQALNKAYGKNWQFLESLKDFKEAGLFNSN